MNRCAYCLRAHSQPGRCCSAWCARRVNGKVAWITRSRNDACKRLRDAARAEERRKGRWRRVAMGRDQDAALSAIFGVQLTL